MSKNYIRIKAEMDLNESLAKDDKAERSEYNPVENYRSYGVRKREYKVIEEIKDLTVKVLAGLFLFWLLSIPAVGMFAFLNFGNILLTSLFYLIVGVIAAHIFAKPFRKRALLYKRIKKLCAKRGFKLKIERGAFRSVFWSPKEIDLTVNTGKVTYAVHFLAVRKYNSGVYFDGKDRLRIVRYPLRNVFMTIFDRKAKSREYSLSFPELYRIGEHRVENVVILNPVGKEMYVKNSDGSYEASGSGANCFGYTVYTGSGFLSALERDGK